LTIVSSVSTFDTFDVSFFAQNDLQLHLCRDIKTHSALGRASNKQKRMPS